MKEHVTLQIKDRNHLKRDKLHQPLLLPQIYFYICFFLVNLYSGFYKIITQKCKV